MPTPYTAPLSKACERKGWSLVQPVLSSSYTGFGHGSLERDSQELDELLQYLTTHRSCETVGLVGHSTGCQQTVHYLQHGLAQNKEKVKVAVLQAPVSDREHAMTEPNYTKHVDLAKGMVAESKGQEMMPRQAFWAPITAQRLLDLHEIGGSDDFFSSDFTDTQLSDRLSHMGANCPSVMVVWSGSDEYVPTTVDGAALMNRLVAAMNSSGGQSAKGLYLAAGNHNLSKGPDDTDTFVEQVCKLLGDAA
jgi:pimeloyl-ACP methyl ester carboxylesterase